VLYDIEIKKKTISLDVTYYQKNNLKNQLKAEFFCFFSCHYFRSDYLKNELEKSET